MNRCTCTLLILSAALLFGCATSRVVDNKILFHVTEERAIMSGDDVIPLKELAYTCKKYGADAGTEIRIQLHRQTPMEFWKAIDTELRRAGFSKISYVGEKRADAYIETRPRRVRTPPPVPPR